MPLCGECRSPFAHICLLFSLVVQLSLDFDIDSLTMHLWRPFREGLDLLCDFSGILDFLFRCLLLDFYSLLGCLGLSEIFFGVDTFGVFFVLR